MMYNSGSRLFFSKSVCTIIRGGSPPLRDEDINPIQPPGRSPTPRLPPQHPRKAAKRKIQHGSLSIDENGRDFIYFFVIQKLAVGGRVRVDFYFLKSHHRQEILHFIESRFKLISCLFYARTSLNYYVENLHSCL